MNKNWPETKKHQTDCQISPFIFNIIMEVHDKAIRLGHKRNKMYICWEAMKLSFFSDNIIVHIENLKEMIKRSLELISDYSNVVGYRVNMQKPIASHLATMNKWNLKLKNTISFILTSPKIKYLCIYLIKYIQDLYGKIIKLWFIKSKN